MIPRSSLGAVELLRRGALIVTVSLAFTLLIDCSGNPREREIEQARQRLGVGMSEDQVLRTLRPHLREDGDALASREGYVAIMGGSQTQLRTPTVQPSLGGLSGQVMLSLRSRSAPPWCTDMDYVLFVHEDSRGRLIGTDVVSAGTGCL